MATLECGCWTGPWWGINPPPKCYEHQYGKWTSPIAGTSFTHTVTKSVDATKFVPVNDLDKLLVAVERFIAVTAIDAKSNPAAHDAWQLALQHLEPLRAAIERARKAGEG